MTRPEDVVLSRSFATGLSLYLEQAAASLHRSYSRGEIVDFYEGCGSPKPGEVIKAIGCMKLPSMKLEELELRCEPPILSIFRECVSVFKRCASLIRRSIHWHLKSKVQIRADILGSIRVALIDFEHHLEDMPTWDPEFKMDTRLRLTYAAVAMSRYAPPWASQVGKVEHVNQAPHLCEVLKPLPELAPPNWLEHGPGSV